MIAIMVLKITPSIFLPLSELKFSYSRSGGPGGQHVNKTETKVTLKWNVNRSLSIPGAIKNRFCKDFESKINKVGEVVLSSDKFRDQNRNRDDVLKKLTTMIQKVVLPPKKRKATKPSKTAKEKRLKHKRTQAEKKSRRQDKKWD